MIGNLVSCDVDHPLIFCYTATNYRPLDHKDVSPTPHPRRSRMCLQHSKTPNYFTFLNQPSKVFLKQPRITQ
jgi:hypothetical protein